MSTVKMTVTCDKKNDSTCEKSIKEKGKSIKLKKQK